MKATELRIGNFVFSKKTNNIQKITGLTEDIPFIDSITFDYQNYNEIEPIPLTEEWLKKFGFFSKYKNCNVRWNILGFDIQQESDEDDNGNKIPQEQVFYYQYMYEIKYVHQLQNLYFALTGEELTIKQ